MACQCEEGNSNDVQLRGCCKNDVTKTVQIKYNNGLYSFQSHFIINLVLTEPKLARSLVKFTARLISFFAMNIITAKTCSIAKVYSAKCHNFSNLPKYLPTKISGHTVLQTDSTDPERGKATTPAVSILQSTERVANVIATTLSKTKPSFTIARPNLGMSAHMYKIIVTQHIDYEIMST